MITLPKLNKIKLPKDLKATYEREIAGKAENKSKFYIIGAFLTVIIFLIFGIRPLSITTAQNRSVEKELTSIREKLRTKIEKINSSAAEINSLGGKIPLLNNKITHGIMLEEYLEEFVLSAAKAGFVVQRFRQQDAPEKIIPLEIELTGNLNSLPKLIELTEGLARFTEITYIKTTVSEGLTNVRLGVRIYRL